jgi:hypothetical protein
LINKLGFIVQFQRKSVGASIARPAVLWYKTASPQGDISIIFLQGQQIA